jgi:hypothetical protein
VRTFLKERIADYKVPRVVEFSDALPREEAARSSSAACAIRTGRMRAKNLARMFPPFRAEHVGSLLRPMSLLALRRRFAQGEVDQAALTAAEDRAIDDAIALQQRVGLRLATDGEFRRASYHGYFYSQLGDIAFAAPAGAAGTRGRSRWP